MSTGSTASALRGEILRLAEEYFKEQFPPAPFQPNESAIPVSGKVLNSQDLRNMIDATLDCWLTTGRYATEFERKLARFFGIRGASLVNSGSSANLVAFSALTSPKLGERALRVGDEVITAASGFPTTVNPIVQNQCVPVFVDVNTATYQIDAAQLQEALSPRTRAIVVAHTLGNICDMDEVAAFAKRHGLWLIEDCCDALGASWNGRKAGTFGHLATLSFYPAHHITTGEGGAVLTDNPLLKTIAESFRDWGRDCWCAPGVDNTCGKRFEWQLGELPCGYDHKYTYSHIGYNLKMTDTQAAIGLSQLARVPEFIAARRKNFEYLRERFAAFEDLLILPETLPGAEPSWFGFPIAVRPGAHFERAALVQALEAKKIGTRQLFGGNLIRQPAYKDVRFRAVSDLHGADFVMKNAFWLGVYPGLTEPMLDFVVETVASFINRSAGALLPMR